MAAARKKAPLIIDEPDLQQAMDSPYRERWLEAMHDELASLIENESVQHRTRGGVGSLPVEAVCRATCIASRAVGCNVADSAGPGTLGPQHSVCQHDSTRHSHSRTKHLASVRAASAYVH